MLLLPSLAQAQCPAGQCLTLKGGPLRMEGIVSGGIVHTWPSTITSYTLAWPSAQGAASTVLANDGSGNLSWTTVAGAGGAPTDATYITRTANTTLTAESSLGALTTGLLLNTVSGSTGTLSTYAGVSACSAGSAITALSASGAGTCTSVAPSIGSTIGSGTAGSVLFLGTSGVLAQDNAHFFYDAANTLLQVRGNVSGVYAALSPQEVLLAYGFNDAGAGGELGAVLGQATGTNDALATSAKLTFEGDGTAVPNGTPGRIGLYTSNPTVSAQVQRMRLTSVGTTGVATPNASSTVVMAGQVEMQGGPLIQTSSGMSAGLSTSYYGNGGHVIASDTGGERGLDIVTTGQGYVYWDTLRSAFNATAAQNTMQNGDLLGVMGWSGFAATSGVTMAEAAKLQVVVDGSVDAANHFVPGRYEFYTSTTLGVSTLAVTIDATQTTKLAGNLLAVLPAAETIAAAGTITANACGGVKRISSASAVTTNTTNTITAPAAANAGCVMQLCNVNAADAITLDKNANILLTGGADVVLAAGCCIDVVSTGASGVWKQTTAQLCSS